MGKMIARPIMRTIVGLGLLVAGTEAALFYQTGLEAERLSLAWSVVFSLLVATWIEADSRGDARVYRPYEFGFLAYLIWPLYLPYYLIRTRGALGFAWLVGLAILYLLGWVLKTAIWLVA